MYPAAFPHDPITQIFDNVYLVHGSIKIGPGMRMNRNMIFIKEGSDLTLINPIRMNEEELKKLDALGTVRHVIRLGDFHGLDDRFYVDRYKAEFWCQPGQGTYKEPLPTNEFTAAINPPISQAEFFIFESAKFPEAALLLNEHKLLITTDSIQFWEDWSYTSAFTKFVLWLMGFRLTLLVGGPWLKRVTPKGTSLKPEFERLLKLDFNHLVAAHGGLLRNEAKPMLKTALTKAFG
ncbi:MAG TPA: hypothetical protein DF427_02275 [Moraxellaceae bacterium]|nr:hypothetical protein [Moraxellaceae bacterium]